MKYLYAWAPGTGPFEFPGGGIRLGPEDTLRLQLHYNNGAGYDDVRDSSGVRIYIGPAEGKEYVMVDPGPGAFGFSIPPRQTSTAERTCYVHQPVDILATMPHMHEIGQELVIEHGHAGEELAPVLTLENWDFETQLFYELPLSLEVGDAFNVRCKFDNPTTEEVRAGTDTRDEMCYAFTYISPPRVDFCQGSRVGEEPGEIDYRPGVCLTDPIEVTPVPATVVERSVGPVFDETGTVPSGQWPVSRIVLATPQAAIVSVATIAFAGQLSVSGDQVEVDGALHIRAPAEGLRDGMQQSLTSAGTLSNLEGPSRVRQTCPEESISDYEIGLVDGVPATKLALNQDDFDIDVWLFFESD